jgi:uncharacterized membrane protein YccC
MMMICLAFFSVAVLSTQWLFQNRNPLLMLICIGMFTLSTLLSLGLAPLSLQVLVLVVVLIWRPQQRKFS